ncbi:hypothetical protein LTR85_009095 [Meristemomyces frigidus]|nr:hypothetical protein LTR85_009095 [Meristemomyces frigidus]
MKLAATAQRHDSPGALAGWITLHVFALICTLGLPFAIWILGITVTTHFGSNDESATVCWADGSAHVGVLTGYAAQLWVPSLFLSITFGLGNFTFSQAKGIDIVWDLVVGRGGQVLLVLIAYPIVRRALTLSNENRTTSFPLFSSVAFGGMSMSSLYRLCICRDDRGRLAGSRRAPTRWSWLHLTLAFVCIYVLAFPTVVSIMTGYQAVLVPYVLDPENPDNLVKVDSLEIASLLIIDGFRVGLSVQSISYEHDPSLFQTFHDYYTNLTLLQDTDGWLSHPLATWGSNTGEQVIPSTGDGTWSMRFPRNISIYDVSSAPPKGEVYSNFTISNETFTLSPPPLTIIYNLDDAQLFYSGNTTYNATWLANNTVCEPGNTYVWGFSALMLFTFSVATSLFSVLLVTLHWVIHEHSRADRYKQTISVYRDVLDLAEELKARFGGQVQDMSGEELNRTVKQDAGAMQLQTAGLPLSRQHEKNAGRRSRKGKKGSVSYTPVGVESSAYSVNKSGAGEEVALQSLHSDHYRLV